MGAARARANDVRLGHAKQPELLSVAHVPRRVLVGLPVLVRSWAAHHEVKPPERDKSGRDCADERENRYAEEVDGDGDRDSCGQCAADVLLKSLLSEATGGHFGIFTDMAQILPRFSAQSGRARDGRLQQKPCSTRAFPAVELRIRADPSHDPLLGR